MKLRGFIVSDVSVHDKKVGSSVGIVQEMKTDRRPYSHFFLNIKFQEKASCKSLRGLVNETSGGELL